MHASHQTAKGTILVSTACIFIAMAFFAGLLAGSLVAMQRSGNAVHETGRPAPQEQAGGHPEGFEENLAKINAEIGRNPQEPLNWIFLGNLHFDAGHADEAIKAYSRALELQPDNADVTVDMGTMYRLKGQPRDAVALYDKAISTMPSHQNAYFNKGVTLMIDLADPAGAVNTWKTLLAVKPDALLGDGKPLAEYIGLLIMDGGDQLEKKGQCMEAARAYVLALKEDLTLLARVVAKTREMESTGHEAETSFLRNEVLAIAPDAFN